jgi:hypothetical protein
LAKLLAGVPGIQLVAPGEPSALLVMSAFSSAASQANGVAILTPR